MSAWRPWAVTATGIAALVCLIGWPQPTAWAIGATALGIASGRALQPVCIRLLVAWTVAERGGQHRSAPADSPYPDFGPPRPRLGTLTCDSIGDEGPCTAPATWHVGWRPATTGATLSLLCDPHMEIVDALYVYQDRHRAEIDCDMPGTGWLLTTPSRCVPATTDDLTDAQPRELP